jgi:hypothetical protein
VFAGAVYISTLHIFRFAENSLTIYSHSLTDSIYDLFAQGVCMLLQIMWIFKSDNKKVQAKMSGFFIFLCGFCLPFKYSKYLISLHGSFTFVFRKRVDHAMDIHFESS